MNDSETPAAPKEPGSPARRRAATKPRSAARPRTARPAKRRPAKSSRRAGELEGLLRGLAKRASEARGRLATASGQGADATRKAWKTVSGASRKTIGRLTAEWKQMEPARKAQFVAALLTALAAASAPIVRRGLKKR